MASSPRVTASLPAASLFVFPPIDAPPALAPPPPGTATFAPPFRIPDTLYQAAYDVRLPITIAILYAVSVKSLNVYNKSTNKRPWAISKTKAFSVFVIAHNVFLAVYSAWTFYGMFGALWRSVARPWGPDGLAGFADSMCRIHGQSGLGNGIYYIDGEGWKTTSQSVTLARDGSPPSTDAGRLWNEGLAFYGWLFYLSKFYEVLDTFIILAKGKLSSTLQTYHHAGAMMCMWAGMRFMAAPIWIFCFFNSGIHALMYTYYTLSAVGVRVPSQLKRTLTSMQITQFVVGATLAATPLFVSYTVPIASTTSTAPLAAATATATPLTLIDKLRSMFIAAGSSPSASETTGSEPYGTTTITQQMMPCTTTSGHTFAIWLHVVYLAPLTWLFVKFFIASYVRRSGAETSRSQQKKLEVSEKRKGGAALVEGHVREAERRLSNVMHTAEEAGWDAAKGMGREVYGDGAEAVEDEREMGESSGSLAVPEVGASGQAVTGNGRAKRRRL